MGTATEEELDRTSKCLMMNRGSLVKLIATLLKMGIVDLVEQQKEINCLLGVSKEGDKQGLDLDARRSNLHITVSESPELPHLGYAEQMTLNEQDELWIGKVDIDNFYHRLASPTHLQS